MHIVTSLSKLPSYVISITYSLKTLYIKHILIICTAQSPSSQAPILQDPHVSPSQLHGLLFFFCIIIFHLLNTG